MGEEEELRLRCDWRGQVDEFCDEGDNVIGLRRDVLGVVAGGLYGRAACDEALVSMCDVKCLGHGTCCVERSGAGCAIHSASAGGGS